MHRSIVLILLVAWIVAGCFAASPTTLAPPSSSPAPPSAAAVAGVPRCEDLDEYSAPEEWYRGEPIYVANEQPIEEVLAWATTQPGFEDLWIDRDHLGWLALAFGLPECD